MGMTSHTPLVSIVIPTFNCAAYLPAAIDSARAQHPSIEIIVVDDGSTDGTTASVTKLGAPLRLIEQDHQGAAAARNLGVAAATGEFLAFLDADDLFAPCKLGVQLAHLRRENAPDISMGAVEEFVSPEIDAEHRARLQVRGRTAGGVAGAMLIRRATFERIGPFASWRLGEFADWYLRALDAGLRVETLPDVVLHRRLHGANIGIRERHARVDYARIAKRALDRRRQDRSGGEA
jgi:glycosyltransferase involved in cell wall biosynthesis